MKERLSQEVRETLKKAEKVLNDISLEKGLSADQEHARDCCTELLVKDRELALEAEERKEWVQDNAGKILLKIDGKLAGFLEPLKDEKGFSATILNGKHFGSVEIQGTEREAKQFVEAEHGLSPFPDLSLDQKREGGPVKNIDRDEERKAIRKKADEERARMFGGGKESKEKAEKNIDRDQGRER